MLCFMTLLLVMLQCCLFAAADDEEGVTQSFYRPKSTFRTAYDYEQYCKSMYDYGYMDEDYNWTPAAQDFINNKTVETAIAVDENARAIVQKRVENGEIAEEDNPYLTYDEKQKILEKKSETQSEIQTETISETQVESQTEAQTEVQTELQETESTEIQTEEAIETKTASNTWKRISYIIIAVFIGIAGMFGYRIYKRQGL